MEDTTDIKPPEDLPAGRTSCSPPYQYGWYWVWTCDSIQKDFLGGLVDGPHWYPLLLDPEIDNDDGTFGCVQFRGEFYPLSEFVGIIHRQIPEPAWLPELGRRRGERYL